MDLQQFVKQYKNQSEAAAVLGLSQGMVSGRLTGRYPMTADVALDLEKRSGGVMTRYALFPEGFGKPPQGYVNHESIAV